MRINKKRRYFHHCISSLCLAFAFDAWASRTFCQPFFKYLSLGEKSPAPLSRSPEFGILKSPQLHLLDCLSSYPVHRPTNWLLANPSASESILSYLICPSLSR